MKKKEISLRYYCYNSVISLQNLWVYYYSNYGKDVNKILLVNSLKGSRQMKVAIKAYKEVISMYGEQTSTLSKFKFFDTILR